MQDMITIKCHDLGLFHMPRIWRDEAGKDDVVSSPHAKQVQNDRVWGPVSIGSRQQIEVPVWYVEELRSRYRGWASRMTPEGVIRRPLRGTPAQLRARIEQRRALRAKYGDRADLRFR